MNTPWIYKFFFKSSPIFLLPLRAIHLLEFIPQYVPPSILRLSWIRRERPKGTPLQPGSQSRRPHRMRRTRYERYADKQVAITDWRTRRLGPGNQQDKHRNQCANRPSVRKRRAQFKERRRERMEPSVSCSFVSCTTQRRGDPCYGSKLQEVYAQPPAALDCSWGFKTGL